MNGWTGSVVAAIGLVALGGGSASGALLAPIRQQVEVKSNALAVMTAVRQTGQAATMARTIDGEQVPAGIAGVDRMVERGWLRTAPRNPMDPNPAGLAVVRRLGDRTVVGMMLPRLAGEVCDEISKRTGAGSEAPTADSPTYDQGCLMTSSGPVAYELV